MQRKIGALRLGLTFAGCFLGAGYVSGQELWQYFGAFGAHGLLGLVLAIALLGGTGVVLLRLSARTGHRGDGRADRARGHSVAAHTCRRADGGAAVRRRVHHGGRHRALGSQMLGLPVWLGSAIVCVLIAAAAISASAVW